MKKNYRVISLIMAAIIGTTVLTGCGSSKTSGTAVETSKETSKETTPVVVDENPYKEKVEISIGFWDAEKCLSKGMEDPIIADISERLNISIKPINYTWDDYSQKIQLWASSNQLPDIFAIDAVGSQYSTNWSKQKVVKAIPQDISMYPNLQKYLDVPDIQGLKVDGSLYSIPRKTWESVQWNSQDRSVFYRWDLAQAAGVTEEPQTWDEFRAMLKAIIASDSEKKNVVGLTVLQPKIFSDFFFTYASPAATSDGSGVDYKWINEDNKFIPAFFSKNTIDSMKLARDMYTDGLIDKDAALTKIDQSKAKFAQGKAAAIFVSGGFGTLSDIWVNQMSKLYPDKKITDLVKVLNPLEGKDGNRYSPVFKTYWSESYISGQVDDNKLQRILALYELLLTPEFKETLRFGVKDVDYKKEGDTVTVIDPNANINGKYLSLGLFHPLVEWDAEFPYSDNSATWSTDIRKMAQDNIAFVKKDGKVPDYDIRLSYMSTPAKDKFVLPVQDELMKIMLSKEDVNKLWDAMVKSYEAKGLNTVIEEVNAEAAKLK